jgi:hypothetical protein
MLYQCIRKKLSRLSIFSAFLSIAGFLGFILSFTSEWNYGVRICAALSTIALVLSISALTVIWTNGELRGQGYAITAMALSLPAIIFIAGVHYTIGRRAETEKTRTGIYNLRVLNKAIHEYADKHDGCLPIAGQWCDLLMKDDKSLSRYNFKHPLLKNGECNFAFNKNVSGLPIAKIHNDTVLLFGADGDWNYNGGPELLKGRIDTDGVNSQYVEVLLADGSIKTYWFSHAGTKAYGDSFAPLRWKP